MSKVSERDIFKHLSKISKNRLIFYIVLISLVFSAALFIYIGTLTKSLNHYFLLGVFWIFTGVVGYFVLGLAKVSRRLVESKEFSDELFNSSPNAAMVVDQNGVILKVNQSAISKTQYEQKELCTMRAEALIPELYSQQHSELLLSVFKTGDARAHGALVNLLLLAKDGKEYPVDIDISTMHQSGDKVASLNIRDIVNARHIHEELVERELMLNQAQSVAKVGCWKWELDTDTVQLSEEAKRIYDIDLKEEHFSNEVLSAKIPANEREMVANAINETIITEKKYHIQHHIRGTGSKLKVVEQFGELYKDDKGKVRAMLGVVKDVTEQTESDYELKLGRNVFNHSAQAILVCDPDKRILQTNPAFEKVSGFTEDEICGQPTKNVINDSKHSAQVDEQIEQALQSEGLWQGELWCRRKNGEMYLTEQTISVVKDDKGLIAQYIYLLRDITQTKQQQEYIQNLAHYDQLTSLPNRALFMDRIDQTVNRAKRKGAMFALLFIDLDRFKYVNDTLGHDAGDELLKAVSSRLNQCIREQDTAARLGGDEFTIILEDIAAKEDSLLVTHKIIEQVSQPVIIKGESVVVGASIGISVYPEHGDSVDVLIKSADTAMYRAKESGRNQGQMYDPSMLTISSEKFHLEMLLRTAIEGQELELYYQPQVNITTTRVYGCEALVRWNHPEHGLVGPIDFIPLAEETGLIVPLGKWVLRKSLEFCSQWPANGFSDLTVSVNVSSRQLAGNDFLAIVKNALDDYQVPPEKLELEITESAVMENPTHVIALLQSVRELGVSISLDDFGTGYSSLSYLKRLPVTKVKIDRSFVRDISVDRDDEAIVKAIIAMSNSLGLKVIAEGAESKDHIDFIKRTDCEDVQGYYYSRPLPAQDFILFVNEFNQYT